jgi:peptide-methionine (S)-S-oxide reductase
METTSETQSDTRTETASFGAGCFWQVEMAYRGLEGVVDTAVGYEGGHVDNPSYEQVCSGQTGHAEVTQVTFDPEKISYDELVEKFWEVHDPTQVDRQGPDVGSQYRSVIFTQSPEQEEVAKRSKAYVQQRFNQPIATSIEPATGFWMAEEYHQCYLERGRGARGLLGTLMGR